LPSGKRRQAFVLAAGMHIMAMPPHAIIMGMPIVIMFIMRWQHSMNMSFMAASIGVISQVMPVGVIVQVILHIIIGIGIMLFIIGIMLFIIGIMPPIICIGIMPAIIGMVIGDIACIGIALLMVVLRIVLTD
jgi:hypothetical protein